MNRSEILGIAKNHITKDRQATHGRPEDQFATIARIWAALVGHDYTPAQVAIMMAGLKLARAWSNPVHADNWIDLAGYAACGGEIATATKLPREGLPFETVKAEHDAARAEAVGSWQKSAPLRLCTCGGSSIHCNCPAEPIGAPPEGQGASDLAGLARREHGAYSAPDGGLDG